MPTKKYVHFFAEKSVSKMSISSIYLISNAEENFYLRPEDGKTGSERVDSLAHRKSNNADRNIDINLKALLDIIDA
jgi:hypothetical protein